MPGTRSGGIKAAKTNKKLHGDDFYSQIGRIGGQNGHTGGFNSHKVGKDGLTGFERARIAGEKGGLISRRTGVKNGEGKKWKATPASKSKFKPEPKKKTGFLKRVFGSK